MVAARKNGKHVETVLDVPVSFGSLSIGKATCRIAITIDRASLNVVAADEAFCGHRLNGKVVLGARRDSPGQEKMWDDTDFEVAGAFDVKRVSLSADSTSTGLTFSLADVNIADVAEFSKGVGRLVVYEIGAIPEDAPDEHDEDRQEKSYAVDDTEWKRVPLAKIFHQKGLLKSLAEQQLTTVGELVAFTSKRDNNLEGLPGFGPGRAELVANTMVSFWQSNPQFNNGE